ncbi:hypothetical protein GCM10009801_17090 [Streptomyces albiaxialis]|uniref:Secreted protein n=1 Tax=Streptomyces albiaxialis TaxID=329523 RepID=A0ABN2VPE3_9ACTN
MSSYRTPALFVWGLLSLLLTLAAAVCAPTGHGHAAAAAPAAASAAIPGPPSVPHPHPPVSCSVSDHLAQTSQQTRAPQGPPSSSGASWDHLALAGGDAERPAAGDAAGLGRPGPAPVRTGRTTLLLVCRWRV